MVPPVVRAPWEVLFASIRACTVRASCSRLNRAEPESGEGRVKHIFIGEGRVKCVFITLQCHDMYIHAYAKESLRDLFSDYILQ